MFLLVAGKEYALERITGLALLLAHSLVLLFLGSRASAALPLLSAVWLWDRSVGRLSRLALVGIGVAMLVVVFPLVRDIRETPGRERASLSALEQAIGSNRNISGVDTISEMGGSLSTVAHTLEIVPTHHGYELGVGYAYALLTVVPSLIWERHPTYKRGTPEQWLIETVDPVNADRGNGLGYSFIAEAFLNFGVVGVALIPLLIGYGIVTFWLWAARGSSAARLVVVATFMASLLFYARASASILPRPLVWYGLVPYGLYLYLRRSSERRAIRRAVAT
jgi:hypothetical protein